uniref:Uncharacterized protein n=1 Tax=Arundo donax TaxID=35708 RepID=A0A0A9A114_ARUDO
MEFHCMIILYCQTHFTKYDALMKVLVTK